MCATNAKDSINVIDQTFPFVGFLQVLRAAASITAHRLAVGLQRPAQPVGRVQIARVARVDDERERATHEAPRLIAHMIPAHASFRLRETMMVR